MALNYRKLIPVDPGEDSRDMSMNSDCLWRSPKGLVAPGLFVAFSFILLTGQWQHLFNSLPSIVFAAQPDIA